MACTKAFFVASTGQNVGKTTTCLGLVSGIRKRSQNLGYMKPVGQEHVEVEAGVKVDKDVILFRETFSLQDDYKTMSPVLFPKGFTKNYLDGQVQNENMTSLIKTSFQTLVKDHEYVVLEGTGHVGVGSIADLNNAKVAKLLNIPMIIIASGGLGSTFDALALNKLMCDQYQVPIAGVILNKVIPNKLEMIKSYMTKALSRWNLPLLGVIPYLDSLSSPTMRDYSNLLNCQFLSGRKHKLRHFKHLRLVATSLKVYEELIEKNQLIITPASREDILLATLTRHWELKYSKNEEDLESGFILTGSKAPDPKIVEELKKADIPALYINLNTFETMKKMTSYIAKIRRDDNEKVQQAISLVETHVNFDLLVKQLKLCNL